MGLTAVSHEDLVRQSVDRLKKKHIVNCVDHVDKLLR